MSLLQDLPYSLCHPGPSHIDGIGNYTVNVLATAPSGFPVLTLYLLDSHGAIPGLLGHLLRRLKNGYAHITLRQIAWFRQTSTALRLQRSQSAYTGKMKTRSFSLAFFHIPLPEFARCDPGIQSGVRREPTEGPYVNSRFYAALAEQGIDAIGVGHDHGNTFVARLPDRGPYLCQGGAAGFGGYGEYAGKRFHRGVRIWEIDVETRELRTWMRVDYCSDKVDEVVLGGDEAVADT